MELGLLFRLLLFNLVVWTEAFLSNSPHIITFWGKDPALQDSAKVEKALNKTCAPKSSYTTVVLGFVSKSIRNKTTASLPPMHCVKSAKSKSKLSLYCPDITKKVELCKQNKKKVLIGVGGPNETLYFDDVKSAQYFGNKIWNWFLGGTEISEMRPFDGTSLDGVNIFLKDDRSKHVDSFLKTLDNLRKKSDVDDAQKYVYTMSVPCNSPDAYFGEGKNKLSLDKVVPIIKQIYVRYSGKQCCKNGPKHFRSELQQWKKFSLAKDRPALFVLFPRSPHKTMTNCFSSNRQLSILHNILRMKDRLAEVVASLLSHKKESFIKPKSVTKHKKPEMDIELRLEPIQEVLAPITRHLHHLINGTGYVNSNSPLHKLNRNIELFRKKINKEQVNVSGVLSMLDRNNGVVSKTVKVEESEQREYKPNATNVEDEVVHVKEFQSNYIQNDNDFSFGKEVDQRLGYNQSVKQIKDDVKNNDEYQGLDNPASQSDQTLPFVQSKARKQHANHANTVKAKGNGMHIQEFQSPNSQVNLNDQDISFAQTRVEGGQISHNTNNRKENDDDTDSEEMQGLDSPGGQSDQYPTFAQTKVRKQPGSYANTIKAKDNDMHIDEFQSGNNKVNLNGQDISFNQPGVQGGQLSRNTNNKQDTDSGTQNEEFQGFGNRDVPREQYLPFAQPKVHKKHGNNVNNAKAKAKETDMHIEEFQRANSQVKLNDQDNSFAQSGVEGGGQPSHNTNNQQDKDDATQNQEFQDIGSRDTQKDQYLPISQPKVRKQYGNKVNTVDAKTKGNDMHMEEFQSPNKQVNLNDQDITFVQPGVGGQPSHNSNNKQDNDDSMHIEEFQGVNNPSKLNGEQDRHNAVAKKVKDGDVNIEKYQGTNDFANQDASFTQAELKSVDEQGSNTQEFQTLEDHTNLKDKYQNGAVHNTNNILTDVKNSGSIKTITGATEMHVAENKAAEKENPEIQALVTASNTSLDESDSQTVDAANDDLEGSGRQENNTTSTKYIKVGRGVKEDGGGNEQTDEKLNDRRYHGNEKNASSDKSRHRNKEAASQENVPESIGYILDEAKVEEHSRVIKKATESSSNKTKHLLKTEKIKCPPNDVCNTYNIYGVKGKIKSKTSKNDKNKDSKKDNENNTAPTNESAAKSGNRSEKKIPLNTSESRGSSKPDKTAYKDSTKHSTKHNKAFEPYSDLHRALDNVIEHLVPSNEASGAASTLDKSSKPSNFKSSSSKTTQAESKSDKPSNAETTLHLHITTGLRKPSLSTRAHHKRPSKMTDRTGLTSNLPSKGASIKHQASDDYEDLDDPSYRAVLTKKLPVKGTHSKHHSSGHAKRPVYASEDESAYMAGLKAGLEAGLTSNLKGKGEYLLNQPSDDYEQLVDAPKDEPAQRAVLIKKLPVKITHFKYHLSRDDKKPADVSEDESAYKAGLTSNFPAKGENLMHQPSYDYEKLADIARNEHYHKAIKGTHLKHQSSGDGPDGPEDEPVPLTDVTSKIPDKVTIFKKTSRDDKKPASITEDELSHRDDFTNELTYEKANFNHPGFGEDTNPAAAPDDVLSIPPRDILDKSAELTDISSTESKDVPKKDLTGHKITAGISTSRKKLKKTPVSAMASGNPVSAMVSGEPVSAMTSGTSVPAMTSGKPVSAIASGKPESAMASGNPVSAMVPGNPAIVTSPYSRRVKHNGHNNVPGASWDNEKSASANKTFLMSLIKEDLGNDIEVQAIMTKPNSSETAKESLSVPRNTDKVRTVHRTKRPRLKPRHRLWQYQKTSRLITPRNRTMDRPHLRRLPSDDMDIELTMRPQTPYSETLT